MANIIKFKEQGFCFGVSRSIQIVKNTLKNPNTKKPIYLLGNLVHNKYVNDMFEEAGVIVLKNGTRLEMLDEVTKGTVIFTAHGVSSLVYEKARNKNLDIVDATCPYVTKTVEVIKEYVNKGYSLAYIGKSNHPEVETIKEEVKDVILIEEGYSLPKLPNSKCILAHQTTFSDYDVKNIMEQVRNKYKNVYLLEQICMFPEKRQQEINTYNFPLEKNLSIVVGDKISNNANKLKELLERKKATDVVMALDIKELENIDLSKYNNIYIASATSTPIEIVNDIYEKLGGNKNEEND